MSLREERDLSPEQRCLVLLARVELTPEIRDEALGVLERPLEWGVIGRQAYEHGVFPLVTRNLERLGWPGVPDAIRGELEATVRVNAIRSRLQRDDLVRLLSAFAQARVPAIPLKGVALAEALHGDVTLRACGDVDLLVPREAVAEAFRVVLAAGYEHADRHDVRPTEIDLLLRSNMEYTFVLRRPVFSDLLELHWDIVWRWRADAAWTDDLWAEARRQTFWGVEGWALGPEWELLYLAVHAAHHRWEALKWLVDIHEVCLRGAFDWERTMDKARRLGLGKALALTLNVCRALLGTPVPEALRRPLPPWVRLFPATPGRADTWGTALAAARLLDGRVEQMRYLARLLLVPTLTERRLLPLPSALTALYYPLRPLRLGGRWLRSRAGLLRATR